MIIIGAGMAGCLAGIINPSATIFESHDKFITNHDAVLRFRDDSVSKQIGIPFKEVKVHKGIWMDGHFVQPTIELANMYSTRVAGKLTDRSIWNLDPVTRYVAPPNLHEMMAQLCGDRIKYNTPIDKIDIIGYSDDKQPIISTIPMPVLCKIMDYHAFADFDYMPIKVNRYKVFNSEVHQTVYFPDNAHLYRATLTGEDLIIEAIGNIDGYDMACVKQAFYIRDSDMNLIIENHEQKYGKISPVSAKVRQSVMYNMTLMYGIYSLGRFATWRNILLDDVLTDVFKIREMINGDQYEFLKNLSMESANTGVFKNG